MRGRKPKPLIGAEPAPPRIAPPPELTEDAAKEWRRVEGLLRERGALTELDRGVLASYCMAYGRWAQAERAIAEIARRLPATGGLMMQTKAGNFIQNPLVGIANKALSDMARYAAELGMTPSARARTSGEKPGKKEEMERFARTAERGTDWEALLN